MKEMADLSERVRYLPVQNGTNECTQYIKEHKKTCFLVVISIVAMAIIGTVWATFGSSGKPVAEEEEGFTGKNNETNSTYSTTTTPVPNIIITTITSTSTAGAATIKTPIEDAATITVNSYQNFGGSPPAPHPNPTTITTGNATSRAAIKVSGPTTSVTTSEPGNPPGEVEVLGTGSSFQGDGNNPGASSTSFQKTLMIPQQLPTTSPKKKIQVFYGEYYTGASETFELTEMCLPLPQRWQDRISSVNTFGECFQLCTDENCSQCEKVAPGTPSHDQLRNIEGLDKRTKSMRKCQQ